MDGYKFTKARFKAALPGTMGIVTTIAKNMGVNRLTVYRNLEKHPDLEALRILEREIILDKAESELYAKVNEGDYVAIQFVLKHLGRDRGYVPKQEVELTRGSITAEDFKRAHDELKESEEK